MKQLKFIILLLLLIPFLSGNLFAHKRAKYNIVIDTDAGIDDFRALTYFMSSRDYNINCITTVDGILDPNTAVNYINGIRNIYHHEGIPLGEGGKFNASKKYTNHALQYWTKFFPEIEDFKPEPAIPLLYSSINNEQNRTIIIAMGPLSNISELFNKYPEIIPKIEIILWYSDFDKKPIGYNYEQNPGAYESILEYKVPVKIVSGNNIRFSTDFFEACKDLNSIYSKTVADFFAEKTNLEYYLWDDLLPLYLSYPTMFKEERLEEYLIKVDPIPDGFYEILVTSILNSEKSDEGVVFNEVPTSGFLLRKDVNTVAEELIDKHGYVEFKIASLTSEIHSHMGIYSIMGAKMGLRIMEYLHAGLDEIEIISYAGSKPPISCFNDGLQVGTGSTIGYGTIKIDTAQDIRPAALVIYNNREVLFSIKPEVIKEIKEDVGNIIKAHGLESEMYWIKLREMSIEKYWLNKSRFDIFEIKTVKN